MEKITQSVMNARQHAVGSPARAQLIEKATDAQSVLSEWNSWAEQNGRLHPQAVEALVEVGVPRLFLAKELGGDEVDPVTCAQVCEVLANADPSAGWHVMVYNAARLMSAAWPHETLEYLWGEDPDALVSASGHTPLHGIRTDKGFVVNGRNSFVSGCHHAKFMMSPMLVDGAMHFAVVPMAQCQIVDNWDTLGMRGSGSNDVEVQDLEIAAFLAVPQSEVAVRSKYHQGRLYRCPSRVVFATYIPVALSLAKRALTELENLASNKVPYAADMKLKNRSQAQMHYGRGLAKYRAVHGYFYEALTQVWDEAENDYNFGVEQKADLYLAGTHTLQTCAEVVRHVADAAGSSILHKGTPLERIVRDMETLKHHGFANESRYGSVAQALWGADLDYPLMLR